MEDIFIPIVIVLVFAVAIIYQFFFNKKAIVRRKLRKAELKRISEFIHGETARIIGTVVYNNDTLTAPLSGRKCSHYYVHIEEYVSSGKSGNWRTRIEEEVSGTVLLKEGNHYALIKRAKLESYIVQDREYSSGFLKDAEGHLEDYLNKHGHESENFFGFNKKMRYREGVLEAGEKVAVAGLGEWKNAEDVGLSSEYQKVLVMHCGPDVLYMTDDEKSTTVEQY